MILPIGAFDRVSCTRLASALRRAPILLARNAIAATLIDFFAFLAPSAARSRGSCKQRWQRHQRSNALRTLRYCVIKFMHSLNLTIGKPAAAKSMTGNQRSPSLPVIPRSVRAACSARLALIVPFDAWRQSILPTSAAPKRLAAKCALLTAGRSRMLTAAIALRVRRTTITVPCAKW